jgi:hypothetical protein
MGFRVRTAPLSLSLAIGMPRGQDDEKSKLPAEHLLYGPAVTGIISARAIVAEDQSDDPGIVAP